MLDEIYWKYRPVGFYYVKKLKELRINRGYDIHRLREFFPNHVPEIDNDVYEYDEIDIKLNTPPRNDMQKMAVTFMVGEGQFKSNKNYTQLLMALNAGFGKTFCGIFATCYFKSKAVIFVPLAKLLNQWKELIQKKVQ